MSVIICLITLTGCESVKEVVAEATDIDYISTEESAAIHGNSESYFFSDLNIKEVTVPEQEYLPDYDQSGPANSGINDVNDGVLGATSNAIPSNTEPIIYISFAHNKESLAGFEIEPKTDNWKIAVPITFDSEGKVWSSQTYTGEADVKAALSELWIAYATIKKESSEQKSLSDWCVDRLASDEISRKDDGPISAVYNKKVYKEFDILKGIADKLSVYLKQDGYKVVQGYTSTSLLSYREKALLANKSGASLHLILELDEGPTGSTGVYAVVPNSMYGASTEISIASSSIADTVLSSLVNEANCAKYSGAISSKELRNYGRVVTAGMSSSSNTILNNSTLPAFIVNCGFLNTEDIESLIDKSYQDLLANSIRSGIKESIQIN